jgi:hypothetical protein
MAINEITSMRQRHLREKRKIAENVSLAALRNSIYNKARLKLEQRNNKRGGGGSGAAGESLPARHVAKLSTVLIISTRMLCIIYQAENEILSASSVMA